MKNPALIYTKKEPFLDMEYSARMTLPPLSAQFFRYKPRKRGALKGKKA